MSNGSNTDCTHYNFFAKDAKKIRQLHDDFDISLTKHAKLACDKKIFDDEIGPEPEHRKLTWLGVLCAIALLFDFLINSSTMSWMPRLFHQVPIPVQIYALIFTFFDAIIASLQAGAFAKGPIKKAEAKKTWRPLLWSFAGIKLVLYIVFTRYVLIDQYDATLLMTALQAIFLILIYVILDLAGEGIFYMVIKSKFYILQEWWVEKPESIRQELNNYYNKIENQCNNFNLKYIDFLTCFKLKGKIVSNINMGNPSVSSKNNN